MLVAALDDLFFTASLDVSRGFIYLMPRRVPLFTEDALRRPRNDPLGTTGNGRPGDEDWGNLLHSERSAVSKRWQASSRSARYLGLFCQRPLLLVTCYVVPGMIRRGQQGAGG